MITKITRNPEKFDSFELYTKLCARNAFDINDSSSIDKVIDTLKKALKENHKNLNLVFGKRVESMFGIVAASLGKCSLIKQEDGGEAYCNDDISIPDYRVVLKEDNSSFLVEVKNYHREPFESKFSFTKRYFQSLIKYSELVNCPIKFAIYYSKTNLWVLLEPSDFTENKSRYVIDLPSAMMRNEMVALGDEWISTKPPLEICIVSDSSKPATYDDATGQSNFTIKNVFCYCAGNLVNGDKENELLNLFAMYGTWAETEVLPVVADNRLIGIKYKFEPGGEYSENGFDPLGQLSSMISSAYKLATEDNGTVVAVETIREAKSFSIVIPEDYKSKELPLWRFRVEPNKG
ncbi:hypothetical protein [Vibrio natriegens]|uniref:Restriction endonuclease n=1 Tax=Vibrio natriegens NBRC 15636 = ATCC 14048 = DSM 759 TaxID=1219067 RepID=A0AAN1CVP4_VIBNA|nr:hypothetical protein [Vibrio natriegens]ALR15757.1 hypothetical protein PN96_07075 [Vibrio natriegens NBRC 15636 = ATCC 14048 = DSM 759]ANQ12383.1 hypothetical protein BA890_06275 [Vibrio natriegens NBRC 15636 = ATCC 14048 = DSM 759]EPM42870.1 hypothetical protein M272_23730 [Vibrio natriegens NBRC 15636 = ATCC 14048 = DSM 759]MDX6026761.1 hypothetical protein [Vibrio natriegens NBRC 15636 = ATCC 14048 = DSM 759]UUI12843.1 hypothetical protein NP431_06270 [Vibrio natriegens]